MEQLESSDSTSVGQVQVYKYSNPYSKKSPPTFLPRHLPTLKFLCTLSANQTNATSQLMRMLMPLTARGLPLA